MLELPPIINIATLRRHNASSHGLFQRERTPNRQHPVANIHRVRVAEFCCGEWVIHLNLDDRQVSFWIGSNHLRIVLDARRIAVQFHPNPVCLIDYVLISNDVALGIDNHSRSQRVLGRAAATAERTSTLSAKEAIKKVLKRIAILIVRYLLAATPRAWSGFRRRFRIDVYHARLKCLGYLAEGVRQLLRRRNFQLGCIRAIDTFRGALHTFLYDRTDKNADK